MLGVCGGFLLFPKGFNAVSYVATVILTLISRWIMVSVSIRKPVKIAAGISPTMCIRDRLMIAFLISPYGLPLAAAWLVGIIGGANSAVKDFIFG